MVGTISFTELSQALLFAFCLGALSTALAIGLILRRKRKSKIAEHHSQQAKACCG